MTLNSMYLSGTGVLLPPYRENRMVRLGPKPSSQKRQQVVVLTFGIRNTGFPVVNGQPGHRETPIHLSAGTSSSASERIKGFPQAVCS